MVSRSQNFDERGLSGVVGVGRISAQHAGHLAHTRREAVDRRTLGDSIVRSYGSHELHVRLRLR
jgi:hypothetical protein